MRVMALDIGDVRVGIAVSDPAARVASPVAVLPAAEVLSDAKPWRRLLEDWEPEVLLAPGLPRTMAGEEGPQAQKIPCPGRGHCQGGRPSPAAYRRALKLP